jgi:hypothetical protein
MKKIVLMLLVAMVPFLTIAQKRSKKEDKQAVEQVKKSNASVEYMMIKGIEIPMINESTHPGEDIREMALGSISSENVKLIIAFDYGNLRNSEAKEMKTNSRRFRTMMSAVNAASEKGWEFINSNVISEDKMKIHYYYMKRKKKK